MSKTVPILAAALVLGGLHFTVNAVEIAAVAERQVIPISPNDQKAMGIASASAIVQRNMQALRDEAGKVQDPQLKNDLLEILDRARFSVVSFRKSDEPQIVRDLQENHLLDAGAQRLFPDHAPMPFIAAPGSFWRQHHTYPGGLADHTLTNLKSALSLANNYSEIYDAAALNLDMLRAAVIWHDSAKTMTLQWNEDGSASASEGPQIAGTGAHHIWAIAEALYRGYPADFLVIMASAHNPAHPTKGLDDLVRYLQAAAIIAGRPIEAAGLKREGSKIMLAKPAPVESFFHHLSDHDYVLTETALPPVTDTVTRILNESPTLLGNGSINWKIDAMLAQYGESLYQVLLNEGSEGLRKRIFQLDKRLPH